MKRTMQRWLFMLGCLTAPLLVGCGLDDGGTEGEAEAEAEAEAEGECQEFSDFVIDLIENETADDTEPVEVAGLCFTDAEDPAAFDSLFE
jgi:hypothetical protein